VGTYILGRNEAFSSFTGLIFCLVDVYCRGGKALESERDRELGCDIVMIIIIIIII
jgi:hypothetical protein